MQLNKKYSCYNCGKTFKDNAHLNSHKNRKTPCLIREVNAEQLKNPNRCIFCNKIFSKKENLTRHLKTCKIKNGGMEILADKVRYEQEIRILKEKDAQKDAQNKQLREEMDAQNKQLREEMNAQNKQLMEKVEALEKALLDPNAKVGVINNTNNFNAPINITINNYNKPSIIGLTITQEEIASVDKISKLLLKKLYFNPDLPQNHCVYLVNKKDKSILVFDENKWRIVIGGNAMDIITRLRDSIIIYGGEVMNGTKGLYQGTTEGFERLGPAVQNKVRDFNTYKDMLVSDDAYEIFLAERDIVLGTIKASGCKLIN